ncbi:MAG TPA: A24 family peptidase [Polyangiaceae bacterium]|nr:A24 family peptidase [Polyangiaceae bacterium]
MAAPAPNGILLILLCCGIAAVAISDLRYRKIPNALVSSIAAAGFVHAAAVGGPRAALASLLGAGAGMALLIWPFARGLLGGGDVKLLGAVGGWVGVAGVLRVLLVGAVLGGFLALFFLLRLPRCQRADVRRNLVIFARSGELVVPAPADLDHARGIPYGLALIAAAMWVLISGVR